MSNNQHMLVRVVAVAVLVALHWFPHTHAASLFASARTSSPTATQPGSVNESTDTDTANNRPLGTEPVGVATIP